MFIFITPQYSFNDTSIVHIHITPHYNFNNRFRVYINPSFEKGVAIEKEPILLLIFPISVFCCYSIYKYFWNKS